METNTKVNHDCLEKDKADSTPHAASGFMTIFKIILKTDINKEHAAHTKKPINVKMQPIKNCNFSMTTAGQKQSLKQLAEVFVVQLEAQINLPYQGTNILFCTYLKFLTNFGEVKIPYLSKVIDKAARRMYLGI